MAKNQWIVDSAVREIFQYFYILWQFIAFLKREIFTLSSATYIYNLKTSYNSNETNNVI